ncbi:site-2 protease family protein [Pyrococcus yayanosii]|uniref:Metalloprotease n=1 Tax=Pyrococcus yayanosii (strain CH1 / JCM 16557) TaxID=529709 RepID=F8AID1_PYRYC|nr:site-2 protease family protein [Pyrococcus yayanosii]AEH25534.1 metalloprotease [Pyrococcus yayanosii CH1]
MTRRSELEDLILSYAVLLLLFSDFEPVKMPYVAPAILTAFVFHEIAHRQVARHFGYVAFYRRWDTGIILALLLGVLTKLTTGRAWIFAALGAVHIYAPYQYWEDRYAEGLISLAGPLANIAVATIGLLISKLFGGFFGLIAWYTALINAWLAFFNLLPVPPLDGFKVLRWNLAYWAVGMGVAFLLYNIT